MFKIFDGVRQEQKYVLFVLFFFVFFNNILENAFIALKVLTHMLQSNIYQREHFPPLITVSILPFHFSSCTIRPVSLTFDGTDTEITQTNI